MLQRLRKGIGAVVPLVLAAMHDDVPVGRQVELVVTLLRQQINQVNLAAQRCSQDEATLLMLTRSRGSARGLLVFLPVAGLQLTGSQINTMNHFILCELFD